MQQKMKGVHHQAFNSIKSTIEEYVLGNCEVVKLTDLHQIYVSVLEDTEFPNSEYGSHKLRSKISMEINYVSHVYITQAIFQHIWYIVLK